MRRRSLEENLNVERTRLEAACESIEPGPQRDLLERKLGQIEVASHINEWLTSPRGSTSLRSGVSCDMDRETLLRDLTSAGQHVAQSEAHILKQEALIAELDRDGHDTSVARALLDGMRDSRALHIQHRGRLLKELAR